MSTTPLDTNFKDDILASSNAKRKYQMTYNDDGTVSFQDVTAYSQMGSAFGAKEVNEERAAINKINSDRIVTLDEIDLVTEPGFFVDAMAVKQLNRKLLPWDAWRQSFLGTHIYRLQFGDINGNIIQTNQLSIPWLPSEVTVALSKINIPGAGTIAIDYKSAYLTSEGGLYIYCSAAGAAGVTSLKWQVVDATIVIQRK